MPRHAPGRVLAATLLASLAFGPACAAESAQSGTWTSVGYSVSDQRFSPLDKITADNAGTLGLGWYHDLETARGQESTPLMVNGALYVSTAWSIVKAFDAKTGKVLWSYDPLVPKEVLVKACCDAVNRGVAYLDGKIYVGTLDGRLVALDAATGKPAWSVVTVDQSKPYTITMAPVIAGARVLIGNSGAEFGVRGYLSAYDAATGKLDWRFYTVPGDPSKPFENEALKTAAATWHGKWWEHGGGGVVWGGVSYDPALDLVYFGTGNGEEWEQQDRSPGGGDNLYVSSILAVKASTGAYVWHYQATPGDEWDYDATQQLTLADLTLDGKQRQVVMQANKNGFFYVLDRKTGELISADAFTPQNWTTGIDRKTGRPIEKAEARYDKSGKLFINMPGPTGAHSWQPMSFSPATGLVYIPTQEVGFPFLADKNYEHKPQGFNTGLDFGDVAMPADNKIRAGALAGLKGYLLAWNPVQQKAAWRAEYPGPWNGGTLATAGNVVFQGSAAGQFLAYRADNGQKLWSFDAQTAVMAGPMSYSIDGEQYVAVLAGWGGAYALSPGVLAGKSGNEWNRSRLLVFKLGGTASLPALKPEPVAALDPPPSRADAKTLAEGGALFGRYCGVCHGDAAVGGHIVPDLRRSALLADDGWFDVVLGGALKSEGMVSWAPVIDHDQAAAIREYVIKRANEDKALEAGPAAK